MRISDKAIVLQTIPYGDKKKILKLFCRDHGLMTAAAITGTSATAKIKAAHLRPMNLLDARFTKKQNKDIQQLTEASCYYISDTVPTSLQKLSIAQFLNEVLLKVVKEQSHNTALFDFVEGCIRFLNENENGFVNLHIYFLIELNKFIGFEPHNNFSEKFCYFDCREGRFTSEPISFPFGLDKNSSALLAHALEKNCLEEKLSNAQRFSLLESLSAYYQQHIPGFNHLKSLSVLREVAAA
jgi:DNA repair protein RecO (recombination protein O)